MPDQLNTTPSMGREPIQLALPIGNPACSIPATDPTDVVENLPGAPSMLIVPAVRVSVISGCEAAEGAFIVATNLRSSERVEPTSRTLDVVNVGLDPTVSSSQLALASNGAFEGSREAPVASRPPTDCPRSHVDANRQNPEKAWHETSGRPQIGATDQASERVDASQPLVEEPQADRTEDNRISSKVADGSICALDAPQNDTELPIGEQDHAAQAVAGAVDRLLPETVTSQIPAIDALPPDIAEAVRQVVGDQLDTRSKRRRTKTELRSSAPTRVTGGYEKYRWKASYGTLIKHCQDKPNAERNVALLRRLMRELGRAEADDASPDLENDVTMDAFLASVGRNPNRVSALRYIRLLAKDPAKQGFAQMVRAVIVRWTEQGGSITSLAREIGIVAPALWRFANHDDVRPQKSRRAALQQLEDIGGLERGSLTQYIASWTRTAFVFRERYFDLENPFYSLRQTETSISPLSGNVIPQMQAFCEFKTSKKINPIVVLPDGTERKLIRSGVWTKSIRPASVPEEFTEWELFPSARMGLIMVSKTCSSVTSLCGKPADSLVIVLDVEAMERVMEHEVQLAGGFNNGHQNQIRTILQLLHPEHGFLVQLPEIFEPEARRLGILARDLPWAEFVAAKHAEISLLPGKLAPDRPSRRRATRSRDKKRKLVELLSRSDSYGQVVYPTLQRMFAEMPPNSAPEYVRLDFEIKYLTLVLFAACPMRLLNWANAEWDTNLRKRDGRWWVHVPEVELKNRRVAPGDFVFVLPDWASAAVERYSASIRPKMGKANPDAEKLVLAGPIQHDDAEGASNRGYDRAMAGNRVYANIYERMRTVTGQLWNLAISPHDWRDIYATDYLNKHPGEVLTVAAVLNDKIETVLAEYAKPDTARLSRHAAKALDAEWVAVAARLGSEATSRRKAPPSA